MGWPTAREGHGHGARIVVVGVTPHQGRREGRLQGKAWQVLGADGKGGIRDGERHNWKAAHRWTELKHWRARCSETDTPRVRREAL
jgi:hypothetical protein